MAGPNRVLAHARAAGAEEDLDPARPLPERDRLLLALRKRRLELDGAEHIERDGHDRSRASCTTPARVSTSTRLPSARTAATGVSSRISTGAAEAIASSNAPVPSASVTRPPVYWARARL